MERNANDLPESNSGRSDAGANTGASGAGSIAGQGGYGNSGDITGNQGYQAGTPGSNPGDMPVGGLHTGGMSGDSSSGLADRASDAMDSAKDKLADVSSTVRDKAADLGSAAKEKASNAKSSLADMLETGADKLRQRTQGGDVSMSGSGAAALSNSGTAAQVGDKVASGMQATADWLREADMDSMKAAIETQVKEHPGRTLLIALGAGYLLGKTLRK